MQPPPEPTHTTKSQCTISLWTGAEAVHDSYILNSCSIRARHSDSAHRRWSPMVLLLLLLPCVNTLLDTFDYLLSPVFRSPHLYLLFRPLPIPRCHPGIYYYCVIIVKFCLIQKTEKAKTKRENPRELRGSYGDKLVAMPRGCWQQIK